MSCGRGGWWDSIEWSEVLDSSGVGGASEYGMGEWWVGDGLIRMNMRDIRNDEVLIVRSDCAVELISNDGYIGERVDYLMQLPRDP